MTLVFPESGMEFDFTGAIAAERLDDRDGALPPGKAVDFVVEEDTRVLLVEVKDPSIPSIPPHKRAEVTGRETEKRISGDLINGDLVPKARDSYTYLHLMARDDKPFLFVVVEDTSALRLEEALLASFHDRLLARLRHEARDPWKREYVADCIVVSPETWSTAFPMYGLRRLPASAAPEGTPDEL